MGPLSGLKVIEIAGIGPGPFCAMMLADMGAEVVRIDRRSSAGEGSKFDVLNRGRRSLALDLKHAEGRRVAFELARSADIVIESFRPGVMQRLGLGRLPGDLRFRLFGRDVFVPLASTVLVSVLVSLLVKWLGA